jgi:uncharacterized RDD family membrane protein YckC
MTEENNLIHETLLQSTEEKAPLSEEGHMIETAPLQFAGFWMRFWAYLADLIIIGSLNRILIHPIFTFVDSDSTFSFLSPEMIATTIVFYVYFVLMTKFFSQTLGKMIFGLKVVTVKADKMTWGTLIFRELIGRFISKTTVIGYLLVGLLPKKQGLHDIFADTSVVLVKR